MRDVGNFTITYIASDDVAIGYNTNSFQSKWISIDKYGLLRFSSDEEVIGVDEI